MLQYCAGSSPIIFHIFCTARRCLAASKYISCSFLLVWLGPVSLLKSPLFRRTDPRLFIIIIIIMLYIIFQVVQFFYLSSYEMLSNTLNSCQIDIISNSYVRRNYASDILDQPSYFVGVYFVATYFLQCHTICCSSRNIRTVFFPNYLILVYYTMLSVALTIRHWIVD
jgi:hypothetical protein